MSIKISTVQASHLRRLRKAPEGLPAGVTGWGHNSAMEALERKKLVERVTNASGALVWKMLPAAERFL